MAQARDGEIRQHPNGGTYKRQNGQWVLVSRPSAAAPFAPDPKRGVELEGARLANEGRRIDIANAPYEAAKAAADADRARTEAQTAQIELEKLRQAGHLTAEQKLKLESQATGLGNLRTRLGEIDTRYQNDFKGGGIGALSEYLPGALRPENQQFNDAGRAVMGDLAAAYGLSAQQQNTPEELKMRFGPFIPQATDRDEVIESKIARLNDILTGQEQLVSKQLGRDLTPDQVQSELQRLIEAGDREGAMALLRSTGSSVEDPDALDAALSQRRGVVRGGSQSAPSSGGDGALVAGARGLANGLLLNQAGELAGLGDTIGQAFHEGLGGRSFKDVLSENIARNEGIFEGDRKAHPVPSLGGEILGGVTSGYGVVRGLSAGATRLAPGLMGRSRAARGARLLGSEAAYGAAYGSGDASGGGRAQNAGIGAVVAPLGAMAGQAAVSGVGRLASPKIAAPVQRLADQGLVMSSAQRAAGNGRLLGNTRKRAEDALTSAPGLGDAIAAQRGRQFDQFGKATVNEALGPIGAKAPSDLSGNKLVEWAQEQVSKAYDDALPGINAVLDEDFLQANNAIRASAETLPSAQREMFNTIYDRAVKPFIPEDGVLSGQALQDIKRGLDKQIARLDRTQNPADEYLSDELQKLRSTFFDWAGRAAPDKVQDFRNANAAFANMVRVNRAAGASKKDGVWTPDQLLGAIKANADDARFAAGGLPMQQLGQDAAQVLPSQIPTSGTVERFIVNGLGGAGATAGTALAPALATALPLYGGLAMRHLPGIDTALQSMAMKRPEPLVDLGEFAKRNRRVGGMFGAPLALQYATVNN